MKCNPRKLKVEKPFKLFETSETVRQAILADMKENGYDSAFPIIVWPRDVDGHTERVIIDGHTRAAVAEQLEIKVQYIEKNFTSVAGALHYAVHCQKDRRNVSREALMEAVEAIDVEEKKAAQERQKELAGTHPQTLASKEAKVGKGRSAERTAETLGISKSQVERIRVINKPETPEEIKEKVKKEEISITKGAALARAAKKGEAGEPHESHDDRPKQPKFIGQIKKALDRGSAYLGVDVLPLYDAEVEEIRIQKGRLDALYTQAYSQKEGQ